MPGTATLRHDGNVAVITVDNPPVNALSHDVRTALVDAFSRARDDAKVEAIVLTADGRTFVAGADITEFDKPPMAPGLSDVIALIDAISKPVVAAVFGTPLGGGLEITLACHFRVAQTGTRLGLPEIKLGLIPGAGGTQRLPRLVGMEKAAAMILSGDPIPAKDALAAGLIDEIFEGDPAAAGIAFARKVLGEKRPLARARDRENKLAALRADPDAFDEIIAANTKRAPRPRCADGRDRGVARRDRRAVRRRAENGARGLHAAARGRPVESAAAYFLCRARGGENSRICRRI